MYNKKLWVRVLLSLCLLSMLRGASSQGAELDWKKLEKGEPIVWLEKEGELKGRAVGVILVDATVEDCWKVMADWDTMGEWAPMVDYYRTIGKVDDRSIIAGRLKMLFITVDYTLDVTFDKVNKRQSWRQLSDEDVERYKEMGMDAVKANWTKDIGGDLKLEPHGKKTLLTYAPFIELKLPLPKRFEDFVMRLTLPDWLKAVKKRVESGGT